LPHELNRQYRNLKSKRRYSFQHPSRRALVAGALPEMRSTPASIFSPPVRRNRRPARPPGNQQSCHPKKIRTRRVAGSTGGEQALLFGRAMIPAAAAANLDGGDEPAWCHETCAASVLAADHSRPENVPRTCVVVSSTW
jgi:hypothetical protein